MGDHPVHKIQVVKEPNDISTEKFNSRNRNQRRNEKERYINLRCTDIQMHLVQPLLLNHFWL